MEAVDSSRVRLRSSEAEGVFVLREFRRAIAPSQVPASIGEPGLLVTPRASERAVKAAAQRGWSVVTDSGTISLRLGNSMISRSGRRVVSPSAGRRGPTPWGTFTLVRRLLAGPPATQVALAAGVGVSQPRVSRALAELGAAGVVGRTSAGWQPTSWDGLLDWMLAHYPGPGGTVSYWYSLDDPVIQARKAMDLAQDAGVRGALSGDVAADVLAPWRRPATAVVYAEQGLPLDLAGFVPVASVDDASLTLHVPSDQGVWLPVDWIEHGLPLVEPTEILYDLTLRPGPDVEDAIGHLRESLRTKLAPTWQQKAAAGGFE